jgi:hypothetical protein
LVSVLAVEAVAELFMWVLNLFLLMHLLLLARVALGLVAVILPAQE